METQVRTPQMAFILTSGQPVFKTIILFMQMHQPGAEDTAGRDHIESAGLPIRGRGIVDGKKFEWNKFDTLAVPAGSRFEHVNTSSKEPLILFVASDEPTLKNCHFIRSGAIRRRVR